MKRILVLLMFILTPIVFMPNTNGYKASEYYSFYYVGSSSWSTLFTVPEGKDFVLEHIYSDNVGGNIILFEDNGVMKGYGNIIEHKNDIFITFEDEVRIKDSNVNNHYTITGFLVSEDEDIENYLDGNVEAWNKHIFDKEDIDFIYFREFIFFIIVGLIRFMEHIIGRRLDIKIF